jgi:hypothetical protein
VTWLLGRLAGAAGPYLVGAVVAVVLALAGTVTWQRLAIAELKVDVAGCATDRTELKGALELQNAKVDGMAAECKSQSDAAALAAMRAMSAPPVLLAGSGPTEMNRWFDRRLASR